MSIQKDAERNLRIAGLLDKTSDYDGMIGEAVLKLVKCHLNEGHSGMSHEYTIQVFNKVIRNIPLTAEFWDIRKNELDDFAKENMGEPWKPELIKEMLGDRP